MAIGEQSKVLTSYLTERPEETTYTPLQVGQTRSSRGAPMVGVTGRRGDATYYETWQRSGYTREEAEKIASWVKTYGMTPTPDTIRNQILVPEKAISIIQAQPPIMKQTPVKQALSKAGFKPEPISKPPIQQTSIFQAGTRTDIFKQEPYYNIAEFTPSVTTKQIGTTKGLTSSPFDINQKPIYSQEISLPRTRGEYQVISPETGESLGFRQSQVSAIVPNLRLGYIFPKETKQEAIQDFVAAKSLEASPSGQYRKSIEFLAPTRTGKEIAASQATNFEKIMGLGETSGKAFAHGVAQIPSAFYEFPVFASKLVSRPLETIEDFRMSFKERPLITSFETAGLLIGGEAIGFGLGKTISKARGAPKVEFTQEYGLIRRGQDRAVIESVLFGKAGKDTYLTITAGIAELPKDLKAPSRSITAAETYKLSKPVYTEDFAYSQTIGKPEKSLVASVSKPLAEEGFGVAVGRYILPPKPKVTYTASVGKALSERGMIDVGGLFSVKRMPDSVIRIEGFTTTPEMTSITFKRGLFKEVSTKPRPRLMDIGDFKTKTVKKTQEISPAVLTEAGRQVKKLYKKTTIDLQTKAKTTSRGITESGLFYTGKTAVIEDLEFYTTPAAMKAAQIGLRERVGFRETEAIRQSRRMSLIKPVQALDYRSSLMERQTISERSMLGRQIGLSQALGMGQRQELRQQQSLRQRQSLEQQLALRERGAMSAPNFLSVGYGGGFGFGFSLPRLPSDFSAKVRAPRELGYTYKEKKHYVPYLFDDFKPLKGFKKRRMKKWDL